MVLPIGFFAPLPLAIMIPFMAAQSFAMGHAFGTSFQYGKRKISSMSNEEFNAITAVEIADNLQADVRAMIPSMNQSFIAMENFQIEILDSMVRTFLKAVEKFFQFIGPTPGGGSNPYVGIPGPGGGFSGLTPEDISGLPGAFGAEPSELPPPSTSTFGPTGPTNVAIDFSKLSWEHLNRINPLTDLKTSQDRANWLKWFNIKKPKPGKSPEVAIDASGAAGLAKQIAILYNRVIVLLAAYKKSPSSGKLTQVRNHMSAYNQFVTQTRNPATGKTYANLQIDTAKSITAGRPVAKT